MPIWLIALLSALVVSLISLISVATMVVQRDRIQPLLLLLVSFAVGGLFGDAFIHLLPEAFEELGLGLTSSLYVLSGIMLFFALEKFIRWRHCHITDLDHKKHAHPVATINLIGDGVHNFVDGLLIGASFLVSVPVGLATTLAVILHEIPNEIGDSGVLLHSGLSGKKVIIYNLISASLAIVGVGVSLIVGPSVESYGPILAAVTAGGFIYIAGSDLVPSLHAHSEKWQNSFKQFMAITLGLAVMVALTFFE